MEPSSSDRDRKPRSGSSQNRNRSGGNRNREGGRSRRPEPKPTGFQKFIKAITFGLVDPTKKKGKGRMSSGKTDGKPRERRSIIEEPTTPRLYIGNLNYDLTDEELEAAFAPVGKVVSAAVVRHGDSGRSKGFGFVEMTSLDDAKAAVSKLNDSDLKGRQMLVSGAKAEKPRRDGEERSPRGEGREGGGRERRSREGGDRPPRRDGRSGGDRERRGGGRSPEDRIEKPTHQVRPAEIPVVTGTKLIVTNLNREASEVDVTDLFDGIGEVTSTSPISVNGDSSTGELIIEFSEVSAAQKAVEVIDMKFFMGHQLSVKEAGGGESSAAPVTETAPEPEAEAPVTPEEPVAEETEKS